MSVKSIVTPNVTTELIDSGHQKIAWADKHMPILNQLINEYRVSEPLKGYTIVTSIHMEAKTAYLVKALAKLGATVYATGCNPLSTQDDVAATLSKTRRVTVYAIHNCDNDSYWKFLTKALSHRPHIIIDDGGDLTELLHDQCKRYGDRLIGGCEETTTGIHRLKSLVRNKKLLFPMFNVNDADCKHNYDNHYGTGQSVIDGILRTTNLIIAGKTAVIAGYGDCGSGIAMRMQGLGAHVIVTEVDPIKALKANMDGFRVMPMDEAALIGDIFITATGCEKVIVERHFNSMKDGAILANAGHFDVEVDVSALERIAISCEDARKNIVAYTLRNGNNLYLLGEGRLVNLAAADGHAAEIMDMSFSIQLLSVIYLAENFTYHGRPIPPNLYSVPKFIDHKVAELALKSQNISIDVLTESQKAYLENGF
ncbi:adenosylhomocysteinase [Candidatus Saccharibacteria bacterium]|nr:adenosylhomocysteinase [Candidatus Saccharibacteria bacterium]